MLTSYNVAPQKYMDTEQGFYLAVKAMGSVLSIVFYRYLLSDLQYEFLIFLRLALS